MNAFPEFVACISRHYRYASTSAASESFHTVAGIELSVVDDVEEHLAFIAQLGIFFADKVCVELTCFFKRFYSEIFKQSFAELTCLIKRKGSEEAVFLVWRTEHTAHDDCAVKKSVISRACHLRENAAAAG